MYGKQAVYAGRVAACAMSSPLKGMLGMDHAPCSTHAEPTDAGALSTPLCSQTISTIGSALIAAGSIEQGGGPNDASNAATQHVANNLDMLSRAFSHSRCSPELAIAFGLRVQSLDGVDTIWRFTEVGAGPGHVMACKHFSNMSLSQCAFMRGTVARSVMAVRDKSLHMATMKDWRRCPSLVVERCQVL